MKLRLFLFFFLFSLFVVGCRTNSKITDGNSADSISLTISAAVSLKDAFNEISALYKSKTGKNVEFNFGASGALQKQIETGAPVDIFASAGEEQMNELATKNLIEAATRLDFARNELVLIVPSDSKLNISNFSDLTQPNVRKIAVGNPKTVPAGQYTAQVFEKTNLQNNLQPKLVLAEDVRQVLDYVVRGETDAGIVYQSDAQSAGDKTRVVTVAPENTHDPILYPMAIIKDSRQKADAQNFLDLVSSAEGQNILKKYGFTGVSEK